MDRNPHQDDSKPKRLGRGSLLSLLQKQYTPRSIGEYMAQPNVACDFHHPEPDFSQQEPKQTSHSPADAKQTSHSQQEPKQASNFQTVAGLAGRGRIIKVEEALQRMEISEGDQARRRALVEPSGFRPPSVSGYPRQKLPPLLANHRGSPSAKALYSLTVNPDPPRKLPPGFRSQPANAVTTAEEKGQFAVGTTPQRIQKSPTAGGTTPLGMLRKSPPAVKTAPQSHHEQIPPSSNQSELSNSKSSSQKSHSGPIVMKGSSGNPY